MSVSGWPEPETYSRKIRYMSSPKLPACKTQVLRLGFPELVKTFGSPLAQDDSFYLLFYLISTLMICEPLTT